MTSNLHFSVIAITFYFSQKLKRTCCNFNWNILVLYLQTNRKICSSHLLEAHNEMMRIVVTDRHLFSSWKTFYSKSKKQIEHLKLSVTVKCKMSLHFKTFQALAGLYQWPVWESKLFSQKKKKKKKKRILDNDLIWFWNP